MRSILPSKNIVINFSVLAILSACAAKPVAVKNETLVEKAIADGRAIPFLKLDHALSVGLKVKGADGIVDARFVVETGLGLNLISKAFCEKIHCVPRTAYSGNHLSGKKVDVPFTELSSIIFGKKEFTDLSAGIFDMKNFSTTYEGIDGFISLSFFGDRAFTIDYEHNVILLEDESSLAAREHEGETVAIKLVRDEKATTAYAPIEITGPGTVFRSSVEIDTGSDLMILNEKYILAMHLKPADLKKITGRDENPNSARKIVTLGGTLSATGAADMKQKSPKVIFQKMIYDGVIGDDFLKKFIVTFDLSKSRMILSKR